MSAWEKAAVLYFMMIMALPVVGLLGAWVWGFARGLYEAIVLTWRYYKDRQ